MKAVFFEKYILSATLLFLQTIGNSLPANTLFPGDTCTINDICETAIEIQNVFPDEFFTCIEGCNLNATPEAFSNVCQVGQFSTVWFKVFTYDVSLMNIFLSSDEMVSPTITLFLSIDDCNDYVQVPMTQSDLPCIVGSKGKAEAMGTSVGPNSTYYIAVSSLYSHGGTFELCVNTISNGSICTLDRNISIESRSSGGPLSGPFLPSETVSICMNVNSFTGANNGCQWFQGLVPVFGNGWDPSSFDSWWQPLNSTINGNAIGVESNGLYGAATWDWFADVDYHFNDSLRQVLDINNDGNIDMCSIIYDPYCPNMGGILGGCCGPCWGTPLGDFLPPGWFAYGINGTCQNPGPPVRVDWGDGNTCGGGMGPWKFCFDLVVRSFPDCLTDETTQDLSLGFFTFSDGETGSWTGFESNCSSDQPVRISLPLECRIETDLGVDTVSGHCAGSIFEYAIDEPDIQHWYWYTDPWWAVKNSTGDGDNGFILSDTLQNPFSNPIEVVYYFTGYNEGSANTTIKQVLFIVYPGLTASLPERIYTCEKSTDTIFISSEPISGGLPPYTFLWSPVGDSTSTLALEPPFQSTDLTLEIHDSIGCTYQDVIQINSLPCHLDSIYPADESNEGPTDEDPPDPGSNISKPDIEFRSAKFQSVPGLRVFPVPATDIVHLVWTRETQGAQELIILDTKGSIVLKSSITNLEKQDYKKMINVKGYADGVYFILLQTNHSTIVSKLVKM